MRRLGSRAAAGLAAAGMLAAAIATPASAATARHIYQKGHAGTYGRHYHHYGRSNVGPAIAGAALGIIGLAAGAAASRAYDRDYYDDPGYAYGGYGPAPYTYNGYGYGYQPY